MEEYQTTLNATPEGAQPYEESAGGSLASSSIWPDGSPRHQNLLDVFLAALRRDPDTARTVFREQGSSHRDLRIALMVGRGPGILAGMIGVLKAGCVFVPVDPAHPAERISAILSDAEPEIVLVDDVTALSGWFGLSTDRLLEIGLL